MELIILLLVLRIEINRILLQELSCMGVAVIKRIGCLTEVVLVKEMLTLISLGSCMCQVYPGISDS